MGLYSVALTSAAAAATLLQDLTRIGRFRGKTLTLRGWVWNNTAAEAQLELDDGVSTTTTNNAGSSNWEFLEASRAIGNNATRIRCVMRTATGTKTAYFAGLHILESHGGEHTIDSDTAFVRINQQLWVSRTAIPSGDGAGADDFGSRSIPGNAWRSNPEATRRIQLLTTPSALNGHVLSIEGWANQADLTAATTAWGGNPELLIERAAETLYRGKGMQAEAELARKNAAEMERRFSQILSQKFAENPTRLVEPN